MKPRWTSQEEKSLIKLREKKVPYSEIAEILGRENTALRKKFETLQKEKNLQFEKTSRVLIFDIETSIMTFTGFRTGEQYIGAENILEDWHLLSWAAKWLGEDAVYSDVLTPKEAKNKNDKRICKSIWELINQADIVVGHNSDKFDIKKLNTRFLYNGLGLPSQPHKSIDTLKLARKMFSFSSNKLDYLLKFFGLGGKIKHEGYEMWLKCSMGDREALQNMVEYNRGDVTELEKLYNILKEGIIKPIKPPKNGWKNE